MSRTATDPAPLAARPKPTLWVEIALSMLSLTLATIVLNAGAFWLLSARGELERHTDFTLTSARMLAAQLSGLDEAQRRRALGGFRKGRVEVEALWVTDARGEVVARVAGEAPEAADAALRQALYGREEHVAVTGGALEGRVVEVTLPLTSGGAVVGALRLALPWDGVGPARSGLGFVLLYTLVSGTLIGVFGYTLFRRRLIRPVQQLREATARIAEGGFGQRAEVEAARELEALCADLNAMAASLEGYRRSMADQVQSLSEANAELRRVQQQLVRSERLASVGRLAAGIAHEVGNPLAASLALTELAAEGLDPASPEADLLARARREIERIHRIIGELLDYARPGRVERGPVDVPALLRGALSTVATLPALREVDTQIELEPDLPPALGEADKLHQVIVNLLLNAGDAMGGRGQVWLSARRGEAGLELSCRDAGPGFTAEALANLFQPFFTTKDPGRGTGLGLATSQRIVEEQGGWIRAENHPGGGAVVTLGLPEAGA